MLLPTLALSLFFVMSKPEPSCAACSADLTVWTLIFDGICFWSLLDENSSNVAKQIIESESEYCFPEKNMWSQLLQASCPSNYTVLTQNM